MNSQRYSGKAEQILRGALPEFLKHGYAGTSMDKVASVAGVSKQTLYSYFSDKEGLFTALVTHLAQEKFQLVWCHPLQGKPQTVLRQLAQRLLQEAKNPEHICFMRLIVTESAKRPDLAQLFLTHVSAPAIEILAQYFQEHQELQISDPEATARIFVGSVIYYIITQEMFGGKAIMPLSEERLIDSLLNLIIKE